jgi:superfamily II DNA or RNA helicase
VKTFGTLRKEGEGWVVSAQADVATRLKRIFPRVQATRLGDINILDSLEVCRDLEWVLDRWPMKISKKDRETLTQGANGHRAQQERVTAVLEGRAKHASLPMTPAPGREPRDYQQVAYDLASTTGSLLLADELGLGKTESAILALSDPANRPMLAVTLAGGMPRQWVRELNAIFPDLRGVEVTKAKPYDLADEDGNEPDLIVMNYAKLAGWSHHLMGKVNSVVFDEVQELRREGTQKHTAAQMVAGQARIKMGLSATPVYNYGGEMYSILKVLAPSLVGDKAEFGREWCQSVYGLDPKTRIVDPPGFRHWMTDQGVFLRRTREEVGISMPPLNTQEYSIDVDSSDWKELLASSDVAQVASLILNDNAPHRDRWRASGDLDYKMRHATGVAKAPYVAEVAKLILESEEKIILAGWHREVWDLWQEALAAYNPVLYTGTESSAGKARAFDAFREGDSRILMLSLRSGAGLDGLQESCQVVVFGELDWSPGVHKQVLGRLHRPGQKSPVTGYFCVSDYGADPAMLDTLDLKKIEAEMLVNSDQESEGQFEEIDPRTKNDYLREMAAKAIKDAHGARRGAA